MARRTTQLISIPSHFFTFVNVIPVEKLAVLLKILQIARAAEMFSVFVRPVGSDLDGF